MRREPKAALFRTWQRNVHKERVAAKKIKTFMKKVSTVNNPNISWDRRQSRQREGGEMKKLVRPGDAPLKCANSKC